MCAGEDTIATFNDAHEAVLCAASFLASEPAMGHPSRSTRLHCNYAAISTSHVTPEPSAVVLHSPPAMDSSQPSSSVSVSPRIALPSFTSATESWQGATSIKNASTSSTQVRAAVEEYGARLVLNMDETPDCDVRCARHCRRRHRFQCSCAH